MATPVDAIQIAAPTNGLLRAAPINERAERIGSNGITWKPESCPEGAIYDACDVNGFEIDSSRRNGTRTAKAFIAVSYETCSTLGSSNEELKAQASRSLTAIESSLVEAEFWEGALHGSDAHLAAGEVVGVDEVQTLTIDATGGTYTLAFNGSGQTVAIAEAALAAAVQSALEGLDTIAPGDVAVTGAAGGPYTITFAGQYADENVPAITTDPALLTGGASTAVITTATPGVNFVDGADIVGGGAVSPKFALAYLEQALADGKCGQGMIHARPFIVTLWLAEGILFERNGKLYTATGHIVVPGTGYTGTGPADQAVTGTSEWAYATEMVGIVREPEISVPSDKDLEVVDRLENTAELVAQRAYAIQWSRCCWAAVQINPTL